MAWNKKNQEPDPLEDEFKPTLSDVAILKTNMAPFERVTIDGRSRWPFEQYLESADVIRFGTHGEWIIKKIGEYIRLSDIHSLLEWNRDKDLLATLEQFPEEREIHETKIRKIISDTLNMLKRIRVEPLPTPLRKKYYS